MEQRLQGLEAPRPQAGRDAPHPCRGHDCPAGPERQKLDEIRHTVDEQLQDALQKRVTESFKAVNDQLEQVYKVLAKCRTLPLMWAG